METLKEFDDFIWSIPGNDMWRHGNLDRLQSRVGVQGLQYESLRPANDPAGLEVRLTVFGSKPLSFASEVSSVTLHIGKTQPQEEDRQATCRVYFGMSFDELSKRLELDFGANDRGVSQIKCEDDRKFRAFVNEIFERRRSQIR